MASIVEGIQTARQSGYSDDEIASFLQEREPRIGTALSSGYSATETLDFLAQREAEPDTSVLGTVGETIKGIPRGIANTGLTTVEGIAELADATTNIMGLPDLIDSGEENPLVAMSRRGRTAIQNSMLARDPDYADSFAVDVGEGLGSLATFLTPAGVVRGLGLAGKAATAVGTGGGLGLGVGAGAGEQAQRIAMAREEGKTVDQMQEDLATLGGGAVGATEMLPIFNLLGRIGNRASKPLRETWLASLKEAAKTGSQEAMQEAAAGVMQDAIEAGVYNPDTPVGESFLDDLTVGGAVGGIADLILSGAIGVRRRAMTQERMEQEKELRAKKDIERDRIVREASRAPDQPREEPEDPTTIEPDEPLVADPEIEREKQELSFRRDQLLEDMGEEPTRAQEQRLAKIERQLDRLEQESNPPLARSRYARRIAERMGQSFPVTTFHVEPEGDAYVVKDKQGRNYGVPLDRETAYGVAASLQEEVTDQQVRNAAVTSIKTSPEPVTPSNLTAVSEWGQTVLSPSRFYTMGMEVDDLAGATEDRGFRPTLTLGAARQRKKKLTPAQKINATRARYGLPETDYLTPKETREALGGDNTQVVQTQFNLTPAEKSVLSNEKRGINKIQRALQAKNINNAMDSPAVERLIQSFTGAPNLQSMTKADRQLMYARVAEMPKLPEPAMLPEFRVRPYTPEQFQRFVAAGAPQGDAEAATAMGLLLSDPASQNVIQAAREEAKRQGVDPINRRQLPVPAGQQPDEMAAIEKALNERLNIRGIKEFRGRVIDRLRQTGVEGEMDPAFRRISVAMRAIDPNGTLTPEQREAAAVEVLDHETLHALRELDLFTQPEWETLERAVTRERPDGKGSYLAVAQKAYPDLGPAQVVEEAVAEMNRDVMAGRLKLGGRPRNLLDRIKRALARMRDALQGRRLEALEDVFARIESGEVGARQRGEVRTLKELERIEGLPDMRVADLLKPAESRAPRIEVEEADVSEVSPRDLVSNWSSLKDQFDRDRIRWGTLGEPFTPVRFAISDAEVDSLLMSDEMRHLLASELLPSPFTQEERDFLAGVWAEIQDEYGFDIASVQSRGLATFKKVGDGEDLGLFFGGNPSMAIAHDLVREAMDAQEGLDRESARSELISTIIHEAGHALDYAAARGTKELIPLTEDNAENRSALDYAALSSFMPELNFAIEEDFDEGIMLVTPEPGSVFEEVFDAWADPDNENPLLSRFFQYPIGHGASDLAGIDPEFPDVAEMTRVDDFLRVETFAQLVSLYNTSPRIMERDLPRSYAFMQEVFDGSGVSGASAAVSPAFLAKSAARIQQGIGVPARAPDLDDQGGLGEGGTYLRRALPAGDADGPSTLDSEALQSRKLEKATDEQAALSEFAENNRIRQALAGRGAVERAMLRPVLESRANEGVAAPYTEGGTESPSIPQFATPTLTRGETVLYNVADKFITLRKIEESINDARAEVGLDPIEVRSSPYVGEEMLTGRSKEEFEKFRRGEQAEFIEALVDSGIEQSELDEFLILRHAPERNAQIRAINPEMVNPGAGSLDGQPLTDEHVKDRMANEYGMTLTSNGVWTGGNERGKKMMELAARLDNIVRGTTQRGVEGELYSAKDAETLNNFYRYYTPLRGRQEPEGDVDDEGLATDIVQSMSQSGTGAGGTMSVRGPDTRRALGRESQAYSPSNTILSSRMRMIVRANKNELVGQRLLDLVRDYPNEQVWSEVTPDNVETTRAISASGKEVKFRSLPAGVGMVNGEQVDLVGVKENGEQKWIKINDAGLRKSLVNADAESTSGIIRALHSVNRVLSTVNTSLNPEFMLSNFPRDLQTAIANLVGEQSMDEGVGKAQQQKIIKQVVKNTVPSGATLWKGFMNRGSLTGQDAIDFAEYLESGAKTDWFYAPSAEAVSKNVESLVEMQKGTFKGGFQKRFNNIRDLVEHTNSAVENGVRFSTFKAARDAFVEAGVDREEAIARAASLSKNLTVNFNRKGAMGDTLNSLYLFFNASVQGTMNLARGLGVLGMGRSRAKQRLVGSLIGFGALSAMAAHMMSEDDEESGRSQYELIPDYEKERNLIIPIPGSETPLTIPLPYGYNVFHVMGMLTYEMAMGLRSPGDAAAFLTRTVLGSFSPIGFSSSEDFFTGMAKTGVPTAGLPIVELLANENFFGAPIYRETPDWDVDYPDSALSFSTTPEVFKATATLLNRISGGNESEPGFLDVSPDSMEYFLEFGLGGLGGFLSRSTEFTRKLAANETIELEETPFLRKTVGESTNRTLQSMYYERYTSVKQKARQLENLTGKERMDYLRSNRKYIAMNKITDAFDKRIKDLRKRLRALDAMGAQGPVAAAKSTELAEQIEEMIDRQYAQYNRMFDRYVGKQER